MTLETTAPIGHDGDRKTPNALTPLPGTLSRELYLSETFMRLIRFRDLADLTLFFALFPGAWLLPERHWGRWTRFLGWLHVRFLGQRGKHLQSLLEENFGLSPLDFEIEFRDYNYRELLAYLREYSPSRWKPEIKVIGQGHIDTGLEREKGVLLWVCPLLHSDLVSKKGLHEAGYRVSHLSELGHGGSDTRFGIRYLNPIKTNIEERYCERYVMGMGGKGPAVRKLIARLKENQIVSITALQKGRRIAERPFLGGILRLATGGPKLASITGATLLPVFTVNTNSGGHQVYIEPPLTSESEHPEDAEEEIISQYVQILEKYIRKHPAAWRGWLGSSNYWRFVS